jgi:hypothetical protein
LAPKLKDVSKLLLSIWLSPRSARMTSLLILYQINLSEQQLVRQLWFRRTKARKERGALCRDSAPDTVPGRPAADHATAT